MIYQEGKMSRLNVRVLLCIFFVVPLLTCSTVFAAAELGSITTCKGIAGPEMNPVGPTDKFSPDTPAIHAVAQIKGGKAGMKVTGAWISVDAISTPNYEIKAADVVLEKDGTGNVHFELSMPTKGWPPGNYKVEIRVDGKTVGSAPFSVK
jgi:hypothetical protein